MLVLGGSQDTFLDDRDPNVRYRLPVGLAPVASPGDVPQVILSRGQGSGLLQLRLAPVWPDLGPGGRRVSFTRGRFRLLMRSPSTTEHGEWHPTPLSQDVVVDSSISLNAVEAAIARRLGEAGSEVVDVEVELEISGLLPVFSWLVQCGGEMLRSALAALVGPTPVPWQKIEAAFLGFGKEIFQWHPLEAGALPPPLDPALLAIAHHARPFLLESTGDGWTVRAAAPSRLALSLAVPYLASRQFGMRWSFSGFLAAQPDPKRHLIDLTIPAPLEPATLLVVNELPMAEGGVQRIEVEVQTGGPSGRVSHVFLPGQPSAARLRFIRETFDEMNLTWRARLTVSTAKGPAVVETPAVKSGLLIELAAGKIGLIALHFQVNAEVFQHVAAIEIVVGARTLILTRENPDDWVVGRTPPTTCPVVGVSSSGQKVPLGEFPVTGGLTVDAITIGVGELASMLFRPSAGMANRAAYLALQIEGGPWRCLDPGAQLAWPVRRSSRMEQPRLRYRTRHVPRAATGATGPISESGWRVAEGTTVEVEI